MTRRGWLAVAVALALPGCGMSVRKLDEEALAAATTATRSFAEPPHRVALATLEAMRAELASADFAGDSEFAPDPRPPRKDGSKPGPGELRPGDPAFWLEWKHDGRASRALVILKAAHFAGKARDGRPVVVDVAFQGGETLVKVRVDELGDRMLSNFLTDRVGNRLAHPVDPPGSAEEARTLQAFFGGVESREALPSLRKPAAAAGDQAGPGRSDAAIGPR